MITKSQVDIANKTSNMFYVNPFIEDVCEIDNQGCEELCINYFDGTTSCNCNEGQMLNADQKTCSGES